MPRGRPPLLHPTRPLNTCLDEGLMAQVDILLYSPTEGRVPKGAYQRFLTSLIRRALEQRSLDLAPFIGALPGEHLIFGDPETVLALQRYFNSQGTE